MKWITREHIKVDRVACPWLIRRFIDPQAEFLFVEESQLLEMCRTRECDSFRRTTAFRSEIESPWSALFFRSDY